MLIDCLLADRICFALSILGACLLTSLLAYFSLSVSDTDLVMTDLRLLYIRVRYCQKVGLAA